MIIFFKFKSFWADGALHYIFRCPIWQLIHCLHIIRFLSHHSQKKLKRIPAKNSLQISAIIHSDSLQRRTTVATLWLCRVRLPSRHYLYVIINFLCCQTQCPQTIDHCYSRNSWRFRLLVLRVGVYIWCIHHIFNYIVICVDFSIICYVYIYIYIVENNFVVTFF